MKKFILLLAIFCLSSTFTKAQRSKACETQYYTIDIPLTPATQEQLNEINLIYNKLSDRVLGETAHSNLQSKLDAAISNYNKLEIRVTDGKIYGKITGGLQEPYRAGYRGDGMLRVFAKYIKFNPTADNVEDIKQKASNVIRLLFKKNCDDSLPIGSYEQFRELMKSITFLLDYIPDDSKKGFHNLLANFGGLKALWGNYVAGHGIFNADMMRNTGIGLIGYVKSLSNDDEKVRWMKGITRLMNRCFTYSNRGSGGIKPDGSGFHHRFSYPTYMEASYDTSMDIVISLDKTSFQISRNSYLIFRDAIYYQRMIGNDARTKALSMSGRFPGDRHVVVGNNAIGDLAIIGGKILGLTTPDPVLAGYYNRVVGTNTKFVNYTKVIPFEEGYIQLNNTEGGVYRKDNYLVFFKGFSSSTFGIEGFERNNLFGRYQSYGAMEIIVPGNIHINGFSTKAWNWNYNPGATTIVLPWEDLKVKSGYGTQQKRFVGSLSLKNKRNPALTKTFGTYGIFAMDFREDRNKNSTFTFKKSNFAFSDMIVCLGSDINNNNGRNPTVTTLYQRLVNSRKVTVNGTIVNAGSQTFTGNNNWLISNANNGFYVVNGGNIKVWSGTSPTPNHGSNPNNITFLDNQLPNTYGYIDHGTRPSNAGYEYICIPKTTVGRMNHLKTNIQSTDNRPYIVHQKNTNAHIVEHKKDKVWAYALFTANSNINHSGSIIKGNDKPCLAMYQKTGTKSILLSIANPDLGFNVNWGDNEPLSAVNIRLTLDSKWTLTPAAGVSVSYNDNSTILSFVLKDGLPAEVNLVNQDGFKYGGYDFLGVTAGNYDGDGIDEVAIYRHGSYNNKVANNKIIIFKADGTPVREWDLRRGGIHDIKGITSGDFNNDGIDEIAVYLNIGEDSRVVVFNATNGTINQYWEIPGNIFGITAGNYDNDDNDELALKRYNASGTTKNRIVIYEADGSVIRDWDYGGYDIKGITSGDFNNDGTDEIAVYRHGSNGDNRVLIFNATNGTIYSNWNGYPGSFFGITTGDYDGDGTDELAFYKYSASGTTKNRIILYEASRRDIRDWDYGGYDIKGITSGNFDDDAAYEVVTISRNRIKVHDYMPPNRPPLIGLASNRGTNSNGVDVYATTLPENEPFVVDIKATDPNEDTLSYTLTEHDSDFFKISDTGILTFKDGKVPDFENPLNSDGSPNAEGDQNYWTVVTVMDVAGLSDSIEIRVSISDVNNPPVIGLYPNSDSPNVYEITLPENRAFVTEINATNLENGGTLVYTLGQHDFAFFEISDTGILTFKNEYIPDFENPLNGDGSPNTRGDQHYWVVVTVTDANILSSSIEIRVTIQDSNSPAIGLLPNRDSHYEIYLPENIASVVNVEATDPETGSTLVYAVGQHDSALFDITQTGLLTFKNEYIPDFENPLNRDGSLNRSGDQQYWVMVTVTNTAGLSSSIEIRVTISNVDETPYVPSITLIEGDTTEEPIVCDYCSKTQTFSLTLSDGSTAPDWITISDGKVKVFPGNIIESNEIDNILFRFIITGTLDAAEIETGEFTVRVINHIQIISDYFFNSEQIVVAEDTVREIEILSHYENAVNLFHNYPNDNGNSSHPNWVSFLSGGIIKVVPGNDEVGIHNIPFRSTNLSDEIYGSLTLIVTNVNDAPIDNDISNKPRFSLVEGTTGTFDLSDVFSDVDAGDVLTYFISADGIVKNITCFTPDFVTLSGSLLSFAPSSGDAGIYYFGVGATDNSEEKVEDVFILTIIGTSAKAKGFGISKTFVDEDFGKTGFHVLPNPTGGILNITVAEKADYRLLNIRGQILKKGILTKGSNSVSILSLSNGIYFLKIKTSKGSFTEKIVRN